MEYLVMKFCYARRKVEAVEDTEVRKKNYRITVAHSIGVNMTRRGGKVV